MKKKLLSFIAAAIVLSGMSVQAQTLLYSNDFEAGVGTATIVGNGVIEASGDPAHGQVFHNDPTVTNAVRTNYLKLPATIFSDFQTSGSQGLTISFWVNKSNATNYYWSAMFGAYGVAPNPTNAKPALTLMTRQTGLVNFDYTNTINSTNYSYADFSSAGTSSTTWIDAAGWHFYAFTITPTTAKVIIDGVEKNSWTFTSAATSNVTGLFNVASELKYIALGGNQAWNWNDPDPAFMFDKVKIYAGALTGAQLSSLMTTDGLAAPVLTASKSALYFDDKFKSDTIVVNGANLGNDITLTAPAGITLGKTSILKTAASDIKVSATWDGTTVVTGNISLTSGTLSVTMPVKTSINSYTPAYPTGNMIADPTFSAASLTAGGFGGWGPTAITNKNTYSGRGSAYIRGTCWPDGGSLDRTLSDANGNALVANSTYRLRAMVNSKASTGKQFQFQIEGVNGAASIFFLLPNTNGWKQIDTTFTTAATITTGKGIYFNSCGANTPAITDTCFIDNYELYKIANVATALNTVGVGSINIYSKDNHIVAGFELQTLSEVEFSVFNAQGILISKEKSVYDAGSNERTLSANLRSGVYLVRMSVAGRSVTQKIVK